MMNNHESAKHARNRNRAGRADNALPENPIPVVHRARLSRRVARPDALGRAWTTPFDDSGRATHSQSGGHGTPTTRTGKKSRAGFSLLEVLVVIGLIAFLSAAIAVIVPRVANASKIASTRSTIKKVDELLNDRINGFRRYIQTQDKLAGTGIPSYVGQAQLSAAGGVQNLALAKVLSVKAIFKSSFPQNFSDMNTPPAYNTSTHDARTESAACLYLILTKMAVFDTEPPEGGDLKGFEAVDTDGDGLKEVVDAWGHPVRFYRWPTRLIRAALPATTAQSITSPGTAGAAYNIPLQPQYPPPLASSVVGLSAKLLVSPLIIPSAAPPTTLTAEAQPTSLYKDLATDPDDPTGLIQTVINQTSPAFTATYFEQNYHTPDTYWTPLIVSMGPDGDAGGLGLFEPFDHTNFGYLCQPRTDLPVNDAAGLNALLDNITNHQQ